MTGISFFAGVAGDSASEVIAVILHASNKTQALWGPS
jgi:hypothetical protein